MPGGRKSGEVDGLHLVRAVRQVKTSPDTEPSPPPAAPPEAKPPPDPATGGRYSRTAMPTKTEVLCYECGYRFFATGKVTRLLCPKCRHELEQGDVRIDGRHTEPVRTVGKVDVGPEGVIASGAEITARVIRLEGEVESGLLHGYGAIELAGFPVCSPAQLKTPHLVVVEGADVGFEAPLVCERLELHGVLTATVEATRGIAIHPGGHARGEVKTGHLVVEEGGGLSAACTIDPSLYPEPPRKGRA